MRKLLILLQLIAILNLSIAITLDKTSMIAQQRPNQSLQPQLKNFDYSQDEDQVFDESPEVFMLRSNNIGEAFYYLRQMYDKVGHQNVFDSMHSLVGQIYKLKEDEVEASKQLTDLGEYSNQIYKDDLQLLEQLFVSTKGQLGQVQYEFQKKLDQKYEKQKVKERFELELKNRLGKSQSEQHDKKEIDLNTLFEESKTLLFEIGSERPNKNKISKSRSNMEAIVKDSKFTLSSKSSIQQRLMGLASLQQDYNMNSDSAIQKQLESKYKDIYELVKKEYQSYQQVKSSDERTAELEIENVQSNINKLQTVIDDLEDSIQQYKSDIRQMQQKLDVYGKEIEIIKKGQQSHENFVKNSRVISNEKVGELDDQLQLMRSCNDFWSQGLANQRDALKSGQGNLRLGNL